MMASKIADILAVNLASHVEDRTFPVTWVLMSAVEGTRLVLSLFINSFSAKGNIEVFASNTDSGESARNELSHLKSALFAF